MLTVEPLADPLQYMESEPAALIQMRRQEARDKRKKAKRGEFQSQNQGTTEWYENGQISRKQMGMISALNLESARFKINNRLSCWHASGLIARRRLFIDGAPINDWVE